MMSTNLLSGAKLTKSLADARASVLICTEAVEITEL